MWLSRLFAYEENRAKFCVLFHGAVADVRAVVTPLKGELLKHSIGGIMGGYEVAFLCRA